MNSAPEMRMETQVLALRAVRRTPHGVPESGDGRRVLIKRNREAINLLLILHQEERLQRPSQLSRSRGD